MNETSDVLKQHSESLSLCSGDCVTSCHVVVSHATIAQATTLCLALLL